MINASVEKVWDFTQDWKRRTEWDDSVDGVMEIREEAQKFVRAKFKGGMTFDVLYKASERPKYTSLTMIGTHSALITGGGGSWVYKSHQGKTEWVQNNTIILQDGLFGKLIAPIVRIFLKWSTLKSMAKAKALLES